MGSDTEERWRIRVRAREVARFEKRVSEIRKSMSSRSADYETYAIAAELFEWAHSNRGLAKTLFGGSGKPSGVRSFQLIRKRFWGVQSRTTAFEIQKRLQCIWDANLTAEETRKLLYKYRLKGFVNRSK